MNYTGKCGRRTYIIVPKKEYDMYQAVEFATRHWHCQANQVILSGAEKKNENEFYVERPFDYGNYWCMHRGNKYDAENLVRFLKGSDKVADKGV